MRSTPVLAPARLLPHAHAGPVPLGRRSRCQTARRDPSRPFPLSTRIHVQILIYFWNIQMQHLQYTSEDRWNTWNMLLKHLKTSEKYLITITNICNIQIKHLQHMSENIWTSRWTHLRYTFENTDETLGTYAYKHCNIWDIPIYFCKHMRHPDLILQHPSKTLVTYLWNIWNISLQHAFFNLLLLYDTKQSGEWPVPANSGRGRWHGLVVASCACAWPGLGQRRSPLLVAWPHTAFGCLHGYC
jgi:hypothetical protein